MQERVPNSPAVINVPTPISLSRLNDYGQQLAAAYFSPAGMAAAAAAMAQAQAVNVNPVVGSASSAAASAAAAAAISGLGNPAAFLHHHSFFQKQHAPLASPFVFPSGNFPPLHILNEIRSQTDYWFQ